MNRCRNLTRLFGLMVLIAVIATLGSVPARAQSFPGALFTTDSNGTQVNGNIYSCPLDVYISGGPQNLNAPGLPDGTYYFQVTDPSGGVNLSTDQAACRQVAVVGGVVSGPSSASGSCAHAVGTLNSNNGTLPVQLYPFAASPNNGNEYKVYLIPVGSATVDATDPTLLDFSPNDAKSDNFQVRSFDCITPPPLTMTGYKYYDADTNGVFNSGDAPIPGWKISNFDQSTALTFFTFTDGTGLYSFPVTASNTYTVSEVMPNASWLPTGCIGNAATNCTSATAATVNVGISSVSGPTFLNACIGGGNGPGLTLGYWSNKNGQANWVNPPSTLNLVGPNGTGGWKYVAPFSSYSAFRTWILSATATNMAYMTSAQLAAMWENVNGGTNGGRVPVNPNALIYVGPITGAAPSPCTTLTTTAGGFATVQNVMNAASCALGTSAGEIAITAGPVRTYEETLKNALDKANNNGSFVQPGPSSCPFTTPY